MTESVDELAAAASLESPVRPLGSSLNCAKLVHWQPEEAEISDLVSHLNLRPRSRTCASNEHSCAKGVAGDVLMSAPFRDYAVALRLASTLPAMSLHQPLQSVGSSCGPFSSPWTLPFPPVQHYQTQGSSAVTMLKSKARSCSSYVTYPLSLYRQARQKAAEKQELEELHLRYEALERECRKAETEEDIWRYLLEQVTSDKRLAGTKDWSKEKSKAVMQTLLQADASKRKLGNYVKHPDAFSDLYLRFKSQPLRKVENLRADDERVHSLQVGILEKGDLAKKCREAKDADDFRCLKRHDDFLSLAAHRLLLAQVKKKGGDAKNDALKDCDAAERKRVEAKRDSLVAYFRRMPATVTEKSKISEIERKIKDLSHLCSQS